MERRSTDGFCARMAEILEVDEVTPETEFRMLPGWCSLQAFGMLVCLENEFGLRLDIPSFSRFRTVGDLMSAIGGL